MCKPDDSRLTRGAAPALVSLVNGGLSFGSGRADRAHGRGPLAHSCIAAG